MNGYSSQILRVNLSNAQKGFAKRHSGGKKPTSEHLICLSQRAFCYNIRL